MILIEVKTELKSNLLLVGGIGIDAPPHEFHLSCLASDILLDLFELHFHFL